MSKKLYDQDDINDLVEQDLEKGGVGSGVRGHTTPTIKDFKKEEQLKAAIQSGGLDQLKGLNTYFGERRKASVGTKYEAYYKEMHRKVGSALMSRLGKSEVEEVQDINDLVEQDMDPDTFFKGRGPDRQPRKKRGSADPRDAKLAELDRKIGDNNEKIYGEGNRKKPNIGT